MVVARVRAEGETLIKGYKVSVTQDELPVGTIVTNTVLYWAAGWLSWLSV